MNLAQLEVKLFASEPASVDTDALLPIFHRWIQQDRLGAQARLIDVTDYRHVPQGPGLMLIADGAHWRMDEAGGELGVVYARKRDALGPAQDKLEQALSQALAAARALEDEPALGGRLRFDAQRLRVTVMSRLAAGDHDYPAFDAALRALADGIYPDAELDLERVGGGREALCAELRVEGPVSVAELAARLG